MLAIKENHKLLYQDITDYFCHAPFRGNETAKKAMYARLKRATAR